MADSAPAAKTMKKAARVSNGEVLVGIDAPEVRETFSNVENLAFVDGRPLPTSCFETA